MKATFESIRRREPTAQRLARFVQDIESAYFRQDIGKPARCEKQMSAQPSDKARRSAYSRAKKVTRSLAKSEAVVKAVS